MSRWTSVASCRSTSRSPTCGRRLLNYAGSDKGNTFGLNGVFHVVPEKWTFSAMVRHQKVNGLMDIAANETGTFYNPGRTTLVAPGQGGALDIDDFDDTQITSAIADVAYAFNKSLSLSVGWAYDKYTHADAFTDFATTFPQAVLFFLNENNGNYTANAAFTRLIYRF